MLGNPLLELLLTQALLKPQGSMSSIDEVLKWVEDFKKKEKEKADKAKAGSPDRKIFSAKDLFLALFGLGIPASLLWMQGIAYLWNMTSDAVHTMH